MKFKVHVFSLILLMVTFHSHAQKESTRDLSKSVNDFIVDLKTKGIDTILVYKNYFIGGLVQREKLCYTEPTYIFWIKSGKQLLSRKDYCFDYSIIELKEESPWNYIFEEFSNLKIEKAKEFEYIQIIKGKEESIKIVWDHTGIQQLNIIVNGDTVTQEIDVFCLQESEKLSDEIVYNINYNYNKNLRSLQVVNLLNSIIDKVEDEKLLIKTNK